MAFSRSSFINNFKFGNALTNLLKNHSSTCLNERLLVSNLNARTSLQNTSLRRHVISPRFLSSSVSQAVVDPFVLVEDELKRFYCDIRETLENNIRDKEMLNIATHMFSEQEGLNGVWVTLPFLLGKALNQHVFNTSSLTDSQQKVVMISELVMVTLALHDDVTDNSKTRRGVPSANVVWYPYKSIVVGNMIYAISLDEARKLNNPDITVSISKMYEYFCRGQYMQCQKDTQGEDIMSYYLAKTNYKSGGAIAYGLKAMAQAIGANAMLTEAAMKYAQNVCNVGQLMDDIIDLKLDLKEGVATASVIFASKEHPVLEKMIARNFLEDGDVEKAIELVQQSRGIEEAKNLIGKYCDDALQYAKTLVVSPYQEMLEAIVHYYMHRLELEMERTDHDDYVY